MRQEMFGTLPDGTLYTKRRNLAYGRLYTAENPRIHSSAAKDGYETIPGVVCEFPFLGAYVVSFRTDKTMSGTHWGSLGEVKENCTIWIYFCKTLEKAQDRHYDMAYLVNNIQQASDGRWYAIVNVEENYPYCCFRFNTYSDGTYVQTAKIWDISMTYSANLHPYTPAPEDDETVVLTEGAG